MVAGAIKRGAENTGSGLWTDGSNGEGFVLQKFAILQYNTP
jgi:hypothetical protein